MDEKIFDEWIIKGVKKWNDVSWVNEYANKYLKEQKGVLLLLRNKISYEAQNLDLLLCSEESLDKKKISIFFH